MTFKIGIVKNIPSFGTALSCDLKIMWLLKDHGSAVCGSRAAGLGDNHRPTRASAMARLSSLAFLIIMISCFLCASGQTEYQIGTGIFDITGPAAEVNLVSEWLITSLAHFYVKREREREFSCTLRQLLLWRISCRICLILCAAWSQPHTYTHTHTHTHHTTPHHTTPHHNTHTRTHTHTHTHVRAHARVHTHIHTTQLCTHTETQSHTCPHL